MQLYEYTLQHGAVLQGYLREETTEMAGYNIRPAIIIFPGGGYGWLSKREGDPVAMEFLAAGYQVFILHYKAAQEVGAPLGWNPLIEAAEGISHIRRNAEKLRVDANHIAVCGFSAGAHLAACTAVLWDAEPVHEALGTTGTETRPDAVVLSYPVVTSGEYAHQSSIDNLAGDDETLREKFSLENQIKPGLPPFFIWHTVTDESVPVENSMLLASALQKNKVPYELHLFADGCHGMSTCTEEVNTPSAHNANWLLLCKEWLTMNFGYHT